jgi:transposase-like protein
VSEYPQEYRDRARELYKQHGTVAAVARELEVPHFTAWRWTRGGERRSLQHGVTEDVRAEAVRRYRDGETAASVAEFAGVALTTVFGWIRKAGAQRGPRRRYTWREYVAAYREHGTYQKAADALGVHRSAVHQAINGRPK